MKKYYKLLIAIAAVFVMLLVVGCDQLTEPGETPEAETFTVTFVTNADTTVSPATVESGQKVTKPTNPTKVDYSFETGSAEPQETNYVFIGWYTDSELTNRFDFATPITANTTLYAKWAQVALTAIRINTTEYEKTEEVYVIPADKTGDDITMVPGVTPPFIDEDADAMSKGIFWNGMSIGLDPFIMSRYEVTQELYTAVMTGNTFTNGTGGVVIKNSDGTTTSNGSTGSIVVSPSVCYYDESNASAVSATQYPKRQGETMNKRPVENVTWYDAVYFCNQLTTKVGGGLTVAYTITNIELTLDPPPQGGSSTSGHITNATVSMTNNGTGYRLPTEAEWEFAARGGDFEIDAWNYMFSGANTADEKKYNAVNNSGLDAIGWYAYNTGTTNSKTASLIPTGTARASWGTHEVGKKEYNELGLYDMSGNVFEWCFDIPTRYVVINPIGGGSNETSRVVRGGSWFSSAPACVVTQRGLRQPNVHDKDIGFRVVRAAPAE